MRALFLFLSLLPSVGWACGGVYRPFRVGKASYAQEEFVVRDVGPGLGLTNDGTDFYFENDKWCYKSKDDKPTCDLKSLALYETNVKEGRQVVGKNSKGEIVLIPDTNGEQVGVMEFDSAKRQFFIFSVDSKGKKDLEKPYVRFTDKLQVGEKNDMTTPASQIFTGELIEKGKTVGKVERVQSGFMDEMNKFRAHKTRSAGPTENQFDLYGKDANLAGCSAGVIKDYVPGAAPAASGAAAFQ